MDFEIRLKTEIAHVLETSPLLISLYYKGRVALYGILKSLGIGPGDEVIMPAYTCVVVPNAVKYLGARPVYVDINLPAFSFRSHL